MSTSGKIVVAVTGASGSIYASRLLWYLEQVSGLEVGVVLSRNAEDVWHHELGVPFQTRFSVFDRQDFRAPFASGSARFTHMVIVPCSMGTIGRIASGVSDDLITRAADVMLKERRKLVCVPRDTPLSEIHLENLLRVSRAGGLIMPAMPSFYSHPTTMEALADTVVHRILDHLDIPVDAYRWGQQ